MSILPEAIYRFTTVPLKLPVAFFKEIEQKIPIICTEPRKTPSRQSSPKKSEQIWRYHMPRLQTTLQSYIAQTAWY